MLTQSSSTLQTQSQTSLPSPQNPKHKKSQFHINLENINRPSEQPQLTGRLSSNRNLIKITTINSQQDCSPSNPNLQKPQQIIQISDLNLSELSDSSDIYYCFLKLLFFTVIMQTLILIFPITIPNHKMIYILSTNIYLLLNIAIKIYQNRNTNLKYLVFIETLQFILSFVEGLFLVWPSITMMNIVLVVLVVTIQQTFKKIELKTTNRYIDANINSQSRQLGSNIQNILELFQNGCSDYYRSIFCIFKIIVYIQIPIFNLYVLGILDKQSSLFLLSILLIVISLAACLLNCYKLIFRTIRSIQRHKLLSKKKNQDGTMYQQYYEQGLITIKVCLLGLIIVCSQISHLIGSIIMVGLKIMGTINHIQIGEIVMIGLGFVLIIGQMLLKDRLVLYYAVWHNKRIVELMVTRLVHVDQQNIKQKQRLQIVKYPVDSVSFPLKCVKQSQTLYRLESNINDQLKCSVDGQQQSIVQEGQQVQARIDLINQDCVICFERQADSVFLECGHGGCCFQCAMDIWVKKKGCYLCRESIIQVVQLKQQNNKQQVYQNGQIMKVAQLKDLQNITYIQSIKEEQSIYLESFVSNPNNHNDSNDGSNNNNDSEMSNMQQNDLYDPDPDFDEVTDEQQNQQQRD